MNIKKHMKRLIVSAGLVGMIGMSASAALAAEDDFKWIPEEGKNAVGATYDANQTVLPVVHTQIPKITADKSKFTQKYTIDLKQFGIYNDGTHHVETSAGINAALAWASEQGKNHIIFPEGVYLIDETNPIVVNLKNTIVDLNGATLKINTNALTDFHILRVVLGAENLRITNGKFVGDMDTHKFSSGHSEGNLLVIESGVGLEFDHLDVSNASGFSIATLKGMGTLVEKGYAAVQANNVEAGGFDDKGQPVAKENTTRTMKALEFKGFDGEFEFGYIFGYGSYQGIFDRNYQAYYYDADMKFIKMDRLIQYKKTKYPSNAKYVQLEFNQPSVAAVTAGMVGSIQNMRGPVDVHFHNNYVHDNRSLGLAYCGGQRWIIENNRWERNGFDAPPRYAIDFEDGWDLMQDVVLRNNTFKGNNQGDLVVCAGSELLFENNTFEKTVMVWGRTHNYSFKNNTFGGSSANFLSRTGAATIENNKFDGANITVKFDAMGANDGLGHAKGEVVATPAIKFLNNTLSNVSKFTGTYLNLENCTVDNVNFVATKDTKMVRFVGTTFRNSELKIEAQGPKLIFEARDNKGQPRVTGDGQDRVVK